MFEIARKWFFTTWTPAHSAKYLRKTQKTTDNLENDSVNRTGERTHIERAGMYAVLLRTTTTTTLKKAKRLRRNDAPLHSHALVTCIGTLVAKNPWIEEAPTTDEAITLSESTIVSIEIGRSLPFFLVRFSTILDRSSQKNFCKMEKNPQNLVLQQQLFDKRIPKIHWGIKL